MTLHPFYTSHISLVSNDSLVHLLTQALSSHGIRCTVPSVPSPWPRDADAGTGFPWSGF